MFDWLDQEIRSIKTPRFHLVEGPAGPELRSAIELSRIALPGSYRAFVLQFGNTRLYREVRNDSYRISVFAAPRLKETEHGVICYLGFAHGLYAYIRPEDDPDFAIYNYRSGRETRIGSDFEAWLREACTQARAEFASDAWAEVVRGPEPFTVAEKDLIAQRKRTLWKIIGIDGSGDHIFEITNTGKGRLDRLTLGVRSKNGRLNGAIRLAISQIGPGESGIVRMDCYKSLVSPENIEIFALPDPRPEDRKRYAEFGKG